MESKTKHILATAKWCAPCKILKARLQESNLKVDEIIDVDKHLDFSRSMAIRQVPTLIVETESSTQLITQNIFEYIKQYHEKSIDENQT